ncbi:hypothetical protein HY230_03805 [Candidatus Acetothermia bacterium]|nr:hypothetical protein [Candidatus Acetothermia bacterium]
MKVAEIAKELDISPEELLQLALQDHLRNRLKELAAERKALLALLQVKNFKQLDRLLAQGKIREEEILSHYQRLDWIEHQIAKIRRWLKTA